MDLVDVSRTMEALPLNAFAERELRLMQTWEKLRLRVATGSGYTQLRDPFLPKHPALDDFKMKIGESRAANIVTILAADMSMKELLSQDGVDWGLGNDAVWRDNYDDVEGKEPVSIDRDPPLPDTRSTRVSISYDLFTRTTAGPTTPRVHPSLLGLSG